MKRTTLLLPAATFFLTLGASCPIKPSICATGEWFDGDECVCKPGHVPDDDGKGCHVPDPMPTPEPTPEPTPTPIPSPSSSPSPSPSPALCSLPSMPEVGGPEDPPKSGRWGKCWEERPTRFLSDVQGVVEEVKSWPGMLLPTGQVSNEDSFASAVMARLRTKGYCVTRGGPDDEIGVKLENSWSEQFDILWSSDSPRRPWVNHTVSCVPARF